MKSGNVTYIVKIAFSGTAFFEKVVSGKAKTLFQRYQQMEKDYYQQEEKLNGLRQQYAGANQQGKAKMAPAILDLEKRILQMSEELDALEVNVRNAEKTK